MFESRVGPSLPWYVVAPSPPDDVTPDQVFQCVAGLAEKVTAVELSAAFLTRRPGSDVGAWRQLDQELETAGIEVYFVPGGTASWEIKVSASRGTAGVTIAGAEEGPESHGEGCNTPDPNSGNGWASVTTRGDADIPVGRRGSQHAAHRGDAGGRGLPAPLSHAGSPDFEAATGVAPVTGSGGRATTSQQTSGQPRQTNSKRWTN